MVLPIKVDKYSYAKWGDTETQIPAQNSLQSEAVQEGLIQH